MNSSSIKIDHPIVVAADKCGIEKYGSPTLSDQSKISFPSIKMGPGFKDHTLQMNLFMSKEWKCNPSIYKFTKQNSLK